RLYAALDRWGDPRRRRVRRWPRLADRGGDRRADAGARRLAAADLHAHPARLAGRCQRRHPHCGARGAGAARPAGGMTMLARIIAKPWIWSFVGALVVWLAAIVFTRGYGAGG